MHKTLVLITTCLIALILAPGASAATTFGSPLDVAPADGNNYVYVQMYNPDGSEHVGAPVAGVLTSLKIRVGGSEAVVEAALVRLTTPYQDTVNFVKVSENIGITATADGADHLASTSTRVPISAGDRIALAVEAGVRAVATHPGGGGGPTDLCAYAAIATFSTWTVGGLRSFNHLGCGILIPTVQATIEPDADGDGYGDETQDACSTDASTQGSCPSPVGATPAKIVIEPVTSTAKPRSSARRTFTVRNTGGVASGKLSFTAKSSKAVRDLKIVRGCTPGTIKRSCTIQSIAPGARVTVTLSMKRKRSTRTYLSATASDASAKTLVKFSKPKK